jgi:DNA-binding winged helix-turn-helix (wHTH) protein
VKLQFGEFTFDAGARELRRGAAPVRLSPKAFTVLRVLIERRPEAVGKDDLLAAAWPDAEEVVEQSLTNAIGEIRRKLGDDPRDAAYVRTVQGYGYAFRGDVDEPRGGPAEAPAAWLHWGDRPLPLRFGDNLVGREAICHVRLDAPGVSRRHAVVRLTPTGASVEDLGSTNGTFVRGGAAEGQVPLDDGDALRLGPITVTFRWAPPSRAETIRLS